MHVLIVCSFFPPQNETGARRPYHLAKALISAGHQVSVVACTTISSSADWNVDLDQIKVHRSAGHWPDRTTPFWQRALFRIFDSTDKGIVGKAFRTLAFLTLPMDHLAHGAIDISMVKREVDTPHIIVASGPWWGALVTGAKLHDKYRISKLVLDYRDPWIPRNPKVGLRLLTWHGSGVWGKLKRWRSARIERWVASRACAVTSVSEAFLENTMRSTGITNGKLIMNGYELSVAERQVTKQNDRKLHLLYTGRTYQEQPWDDVLDAIEKFIGTEPEAEPLFVLDIYPVGEISADLLYRFEKLQRQGVILLHEKVSREQTLALQETSGALLSVGFTDREGLLPVKNFEYLKAARPVLHYSLADAALEQLIQNTQCGSIDNTVDGFSKRLLATFLEWQNTGHLEFTGDQQVIKQYSADSRMAQYVSYLEGIHGE